MSKQQLSIYGNLSVRGFPGTAILALLKISQSNNPALLLLKIDQELSHLTYMKQLKIPTSSNEVFNLFKQN
jgi:hypothetical protein